MGHNNNKPTEELTLFAVPVKCPRVSARRKALISAETMAPEDLLVAWRGKAL